MNIAIASGKGGTGKTSLAVSLALAIAEHEPVQLLDCDVEEPNCHLFLALDDYATETVVVRVPSVDAAACTGCGACVEMCQFNAIALVRDRVLVFPELCHACGGCAFVCPHGAVSEVERAVGTVRQATRGNLTLIEGCIQVGEAMSLPAIRAVKRSAAESVLTLLDCPPGTACAMVESVRDADFAVLVTEPTPFGLHDLKLAVATVRQMDLPFGVVVNRAEPNEPIVRDYCDSERISLLLEIPDDRRVAEAIAQGNTLLGGMPALRPSLLDLVKQIQHGQTPSRTG